MVLYDVRMAILEGRRGGRGSCDHVRLSLVVTIVAFGACALIFVSKVVLRTISMFVCRGNYYGVPYNSTTVRSNYAPVVEVRVSMNGPCVDGRLGVRIPVRETRYF